ncbi:MAG: T9SS type A sorting domain-containing protein [Bacteroidales bacterium]|nr:T9SS type A sorting domain-containing protein [Bacteroidales bacterium]
MKKIGFTVLFASIAVILQAQIPNAGFESWTSAGSYEVPDQWGNMNAVTSATSVYTTIKGSPGASGNHYIKLTTKDVGGVITPGMIVSGQLNTETWQALSGFPFNQRVENLVGKYQFMGYNDDVATIAAWLTRWNPLNHRRDTIANLWKTTTGMIHVWTGFSIPFSYQSTEVPDTAIVFISSSGHSPKKNSFIWLDDLGFDGMATGISAVENQGDIRVYPSPASNRIYLEFNSTRDYAARLKISDIAGNVIYVTGVDVVAGANLIGEDLRKFNPSAGVYLVQLVTPFGLLSKKIVIGQ